MNILYFEIFHILFVKFYKKEIQEIKSKTIVNISTHPLPILLNELSI